MLCILYNFQFFERIQVTLVYNNQFIAEKFRHINFFLKKYPKNDPKGLTKRFSWTAQRQKWFFNFQRFLRVSLLSLFKIITFLTT